MLSRIKLHARLTSTLQILEDGVPAIASELSMRPRTGMAFGLSPQIERSPGGTIPCYVDPQSPVEAQKSFISDNTPEWLPDSKRRF